MSERQPCAYILASSFHGTLYIGVTSNLIARVQQHRAGVGSGFASRHAVHRIVHYEMFEDMPTAIAREKQLKNWRRDWKAMLIERANPLWEDLGPSIGLPSLSSS